MNREEKRIRFNEAIVSVLYPPPPSPSPPQSEDEEKPIDLDNFPDDLEDSDGSQNSGDEGGTQKLTRAQRKRTRRKKLKEEALRRGKIVGPLLPTTNDAEECPLGVRRNDAEKPKEQAACSNQNKLKQRRKAKRVAKDKKLKTSNVENCDHDQNTQSSDVSLESSEVAKSSRQSCIDRSG